MESKKQTAVEWLVEQILVEIDKYNDDGDICGTELWNGFIEGFDLSEYVTQAKEIEKQQIKIAYKSHHDLEHIYGLDAEQYYKETYGDD